MRDESTPYKRSRASHGAFAALAFACLALVPRAFAQQVERVDPPSWWIGFEEPEVQLLVHGDGIASLEPRVDHPGVRVAATTRTGNPNYLFLTLAIARDARPGDVLLEFRRGEATIARHAWPLQQRRAGSRDRKGFDSGDVIYLVMPDRFANGDAANDAPAGSLDRVDRSRGGARHGGDLAGIESRLDYVAGMGFTQLWMTPVLANEQPEYSYHGYAITDHYRIDPRYGDVESYRRLSAAARSRGVGLVWDLVVNHIGDRHWWMSDLPAPDWVNDPAGKARTNHVHTTVQDPYAAPADRALFTSGWFDSHMPDLRHSNPLLATYLIQNALWWIETADLTGFRVDTYPYSDKRFMAALTQRVMAEYPRFNIVGEEWHKEPSIVAYWQAGKDNADGYVSYAPSMMDFPLQDALVQALVSPEGPHTGWHTLYERLGTDFVYANPRNLVVFGDNHDLDRLYTQVDRDDALFRLALAFIATTRGIPQFFYGTEVRIANDRLHDHGDIRRDFPGGWAGDRANAFTGAGLPTSAAETQRFLRTLLNWRRGSNAVRYGTLRHYVPVEGAYVYFRRAGDETAMIVLNKSATPVTLDLARFRDELPRGARARDVLAGTSIVLEDSLKVAPRAATVLELK